MNSKNLIEIKNLEFYWNNQDEFKIQINDFSIQTNEKKLILGKSGIGKSTFLNLNLRHDFSKSWRYLCFISKSKFF